MSIGEQIANRDLILMQIQKEIHNQQKSILNQINDIEKKRQTNDYLNNVYHDYLKYKEYIVKEKSQQKLFLQKLLSYLEKSQMEDFYANRIMEQLKNQESNVLNKLEKVKLELDELTKN